MHGGGDGYWWSDAENDPWRDPDSTATMAAPTTPPPEPEPERMRGPLRPARRTVRLIAMAGVIALVAGAVGAAVGIGVTESPGRTGSAAGARLAPAEAQRAPDSYAAVISRVLPSVVTLRV